MEGVIIMYRINNLQDNDDIRVADAKAGMKVIELSLIHI